MNGDTRFTVKSTHSERPKSDSSEGAQKPDKSHIKPPKLSSEILKSQQNAKFCQVPPAQRDAVNLLRDCYKLNGGKLCEKLNSCIDTLISRIQEDEGGSEADIRSRIVDVIKEAKPAAAAPAPKPASSIKVTTVNDDDCSLTSVASSSSFHTAATTESAAAKKPARVPTFVYAETDFVSQLNEVAAKTDVLKELIKYKESLESAQAGESLQKEIAKAIEEIEALPDMASFNKALDEVKTRVDTIAKSTSTGKKSIVDLVRQTELKNRREHELLKPMKQVVDKIRSDGKTSESTDIPGEAAKKAGRRWFGNTKYNQTLRNAAVHDYKRLRSELNSSLQDVAEPNRPQVELNNAKLDALAKKLVEFETVEKQRLLVLKKEKSEARKAGDYKKLQDQTKLIEACDKKITGFKAETDRISKIQRTASAADTDIKLITALAAKFDAKPESVSKANVLPFSLPMLANGVESLSVKDNFSLNKALKYGLNGKANHAMSRALTLRINLSELGSRLNSFEYSVNSPSKIALGETRSFLMNLSGSLSNPGGPRSERVLQYFGTADNSSAEPSDKNGRIFIHKLAASNVSAAGFNPVTLQLDAPSLAYKVESGFSSIKKFIPGRVGVYARNPSEHLGNRLNVLSELSSTLQAEVFKDGAPVDLKAAVITPQHAVEASSLILAALPNDLLTTNHDEVTTFMKSLKEFEGKVEDAEENKKSVANQDLESFKQRVNEFHEKAASWVSKREVLGAEKSVAASIEISRDIAVNGRKGLFRRAPVALGNFINLAGGRAIRESFSAIRNYVSTVNQKERLRQQFGRSKNIATVSRLKQQLQPLANNSKNELDASNARALITYLEGKSLSVKLEGPLSDGLKKSLLVVGDFLQKAWEPRSNGKPAPKVIGLTSIQTNSIRNYATTNLARFAADATVPVQVTAPTVAQAAAGAPKAATAPIPTLKAAPKMAPLAASAPSATSVAGSIAPPRVLSRSRSAPALMAVPPVLSTVAPASTAAPTVVVSPVATAVPTVASVTAPASAPAVAQPGDQWTVDLWREFFGSMPEQGLEHLMEQYVVDVQSANPESAGLLTDEVEAVQLTREQLIDTRRFELSQIIDYLNEFEPGVVAPEHPGLQNMKNLASFFLKTAEGSELMGRLIELRNRLPQDVSGNKDRCWIRSAWGAAVSSLSQVEFTARVRLLAQSLKDHKLLKNNGLTIVEIDQIYSQIKKDPEYGMQIVNETLENKQRALMMAIVDTTKSLVSVDTKVTLGKLIRGINDQAEQDFGVLFLNALDLPVILDSNEYLPPFIYLPEESTVSEFGHPRNWPTLQYRGSGNKGHYQFYPKRDAA